MTDYALGITYDGSQYHGWQRQPELPTIQGALEQALSQIADNPVALAVAGRTDTGVHATGQVAGFKSDAPRSLNDWLRGVNALTPDSIRVNWVAPVPPGFHPRYSAVARRYQQPQNLWTVIVGPAALKEKLEKLRPVVVIEPEDLIESIQIAGR